MMGFLASKAGLAIGGIAIAGAFGLGYSTGAKNAAATYSSRLISEMEGTSAALYRKDEEIALCQAQVEKINRSLADQGRKLAQEMARDRKARAAAQQEQINQSQQSKLRLERAVTALEEIGKVVTSDDFQDECAGADADKRIVGLLNDALRAPAAPDSDPDGGSLLPAAESGD